MAEDYGDDERERLQEELSSVKRRFSHNKVKRKWVSGLHLNFGLDWFGLVLVGLLCFLFGLELSSMKLFA